MPAPTFASTIPALAQYINRIGAQEKNFRRWMVQEDFGHYYKERCVIKVDHDGTIGVTDTAYAPTAAEQAAITLAFAAGIELPRSMEVRPAAVQDLLVMLRAEHQEHAVDTNGDPLFFTFYNQRNGNVIMVQQRIDTREGKRYLPWCFWSDGMWRCMEPDGDLPFWKPKQSTEKRKLMVHEGAKAAQFVTAICEDANSAHPWAEELREYEHWGMIGGALSPHRADYAELWDREPEVVVYVCDNDWPGRNALSPVSKKYKRTMRGIYFDERWPSHWDMADPMPTTRAFFGATGHYVGPRLHDLMRLCTWATEQIPPPAGSKARPTTVINPYFIKEWAHVREPEVYVNVHVARHYMNERAFNSWVNPFSDTDDTAKVLRRRDAHKAAGLRYDPSKPSGLMKDGHDHNFVNTYVPNIIKPLPGDCSPWIDYLEATFPIAADRAEVIRWAATLVCHPEIKMSYGVLLISETQGVGKSTLGSDILKPMVGAWNCSEPSEATVVDNNFNSWCAHKRLAVIHEIYAGHNAKAYDKLKSVITEKVLQVNEKYMPTYHIDNWLHVIACSNSKRALKLSMDDRRWLVPAVSEAKRDPSLWRRLHDWLTMEGGHGKIKQWMLDWLELHGHVVAGVDAPGSSTKQEVVREGYGQGGEMVSNFLARLSQESGVHVVSDIELQRMVRDHIYEGRNSDKLERAATLRKIAKGEGWHVLKEPITQVSWGISRGSRAYAITNDETVAALESSAFLERYPRPTVDVAAKARMYWPNV